MYDNLANEKERGFGLVSMKKNANVMFNIEIDQQANDDDDQILLTLS